MIEPIPVVLVAAETDELLDAVEEFAGEDVIEEFGRLEIAEFPEYCEATADGDVDVTLLADRSKTDIRLLGLNFGVPLNSTEKQNNFHQ